MARIAIVGGGAAGMGAAKVMIEAGVDVTLFEELPRLGGHCFAVPVPHGKTQLLLDAGVSDFNRATSHEVRRFMTDLGLSVYPVKQDTTCTTITGDAVWTTKGRRRAVGGIADEARFFADVDTFQATCVEVTAEARFSDWTARRYLDEYGYGPDFRKSFYNPRAGGSFPMPDRDPEDYFIRPLVAYWQMDGSVGAGPAERMVVEHGMHAWPAAFHIWFEQQGGKLRLGSRVVGVARRPRGIRLRLETHDGAHESRWFDHVVFAASPHAIRSLLEDPTVDEGTLLGAFQWQRARVAVHRDATYVCRDHELIAAYNYVIGEADQPETRPTLTLYPKRLAGLPADAPDVFVTINPHRAVKDLVANRFFVHPALARPIDVTARRITELQGEANTWFAGGWLRTPHVHEQALATGLEVGRQIVEKLRRGAHGSGPLRRPKHTYLDGLRASPIFAQLDPCLLEEIRMAARPYEARAGEVICREGLPSSGMVVVTDGEAVGTRGGRTIATVGAGAMIGELSLLDGKECPLTFVARTPVAGWYFDREGFEQLRKDTRPGAFAVLDQIARTEMALMRELVEQRWGKIVPADAPAWTAAHVIGPAAPFLLAMEIPEASRLRALLWEFPAGAMILRAGEPGHRFLVLTQGAVAVTAHDGTELLVAGPGDLPGVLAVIDGGRQPFSFVAREPTIAAVIDAEQFRALRYGGSALAAALLPRVHAYLLDRYRPLLEATLGAS
jgi:predicted NAD/FAD-binding protein/CRP-like cAMP-binding protein